MAELERASSGGARPGGSISSVPPRTAANMAEEESSVVALSQVDIQCAEGGHGHGDGDVQAAREASCVVPPSNVGIQCGGVLAFRGDDGAMEFYAPPDGVKVEDLCFEEHGGAASKRSDGSSHPCCGDSTPHIHAHVRADGQCDCDQTVPLCKQDAPPKLRDEDLLPPNILGSSSRLVHGQLRRRCGHEHTAGCGHTAIQHGDHVDYLVAAAVRLTSTCSRATHFIIQI